MTRWILATIFMVLGFAPLISGIVVLWIGDGAMTLVDSVLMFVLTAVCWFGAVEIFRGIGP